MTPSEHALHKLHRQSQKIATSMAPAQTRKRKSEDVESKVEHGTPTSSPTRKRTKITQSQKQALIDNLQLEITDRARGLRAHYALQCADLRARIERRINRIPIALRKAKMGELLEKHSHPTRPKAITTAGVSHAAVAAALSSKLQERPLPSVPQSHAARPLSPIRPVQQSLSCTPRGKKRKTSEIVIAADEESEAVQQTVNEENLAVHKNPKRAKTATGARNVSRTNKPGNVLSPKSHNSRTLPQSPLKDQKLAPSSPSKPSYIARPVSPLKPASPFKTAASAATSAISASFHGMMEHAKRNGNPAGPRSTNTTSQQEQATVNAMVSSSSTTANAAGKMLPPPRPTTARSASAQSTSSSGSGTSTTTVVKRVGAGLGAAVKRAASKKATGAAGAAPPKPSAMRNANGNGATAISAQGKKVVVAEPAAGRRVLRKRN